MEQPDSRSTVAIVGMSCRFPGAQDPRAFWELLRAGRDAIQEIPSDRWDVARYWHPNPEAPGTYQTRWGGFLDRIADFDAAFFGLSPREASRMDPQQRLLLEVAWEALEDAGLVPSQLAGRPVGVFVGVSNNDYGSLQHNAVASINAYTNVGGALSLAANRLSHSFDFRGPSLSIDTACSSSLVALHLARESLRRGEVPLALVGGVNLLLRPEPFVGFSKAAMLAPDGRCKAFDSRANGYVRAEGAAVLVLKRLSQALNDGDPIHGVLLATGVNSDGRTPGISLPNAEAQEELLRTVYERAGVSPSVVTYVEAHGTGTPAGDPIECAALGRVLGPGRAVNQDCWIGSVKTNIGHLEPASGLAGVIKVLLALRHQGLPPSLHFQTPNPNISFAELRLKVPTELTPLPVTGQPRIMGVNSFGFGGTSGHAVVQEFRSPLAAERPLVPVRPRLLLLSARAPEALKQLARRYADWLQGEPAPDLRDVCATAATRRDHLDHRLAVVGEDRAELVEKLLAFQAGDDRLGLENGRCSPEKDWQVAFVFTGNGPQWYAMGRELLQAGGPFREAVERVDALFRPRAGWSLLAELTANEEDSRMDRTEVAQPALFAVQAGLLEQLSHWGIEPNVVLGHSVGEIAAAYAAGALSLEQAVRVVLERSRAQARTAGLGRMAAAGISLAQAQELLDAYPGLLSLAAVNSPCSVTLSGDAGALQAVGEELVRRKLFFRLLPLDYAFHSPVMDTIRDELLAQLRDLSPSPARLPLLSTVTGTAMDGKDLGADYWWANVRQPVLFAEVIQGLIRQGVTNFLEVGPHPALRSYLSECLEAEKSPGHVLATLRRKEPEQAGLLTLLGRCHTLGARWRPRTLAEPGSRFVSLPHYPWQHEPYWNGTEEARGKQEHPLLGCRRPGLDAVWEQRLDRRRVLYLPDHGVQGAVVFPAAGYLEMALTAVQLLGVEGPCVLEGLDIRKALVLPENQPPLLQTVFQEEDSTFRITSQAAGEGPWVLHALGKWSAQTVAPTGGPVDLALLRGNCPRPVSPVAFYRLARRHGLEYGPAFRGVSGVWVGADESFGEIVSPPEIVAELAGYRFHPALLDACIQVAGLCGALTGDRSPARQRTFLPVRVERFHFRKPPTASLSCHARIERREERSLVVGCTVYDDQGQVCCEMEGFRLQGIDFSQGDQGTGLLYQFQWQRQTSRGPRPHVGSLLPGPEQLAAHLAPKVEDLAHQLDRASYQRLSPRLDQLCAAYALEAVKDLQAQGEPNAPVRESLLAHGLVGPTPMLGRLLGMLVEDGFLEPREDGWARPSLPAADSGLLWRQLYREFPAYHAELLLLARCGTNLARVLRGQVNALELIFPSRGIDVAQHLYETAPFHRISNCILRQTVAELVRALPSNRSLRVLELGAGTGGTTSFLLPVLPPDRTEYVFTDLSEAFLTRAEQRFAEFSFVRYALLDIEKPIPAEHQQGYDLVIAANVLHATSDLRQTLDHVRQLLAGNGLLLLVEKQPDRMSDVIFGLLSGWWRFQDRNLRPDSALLSPARWREVLAQSGFVETATLTDCVDGEKPQQAVVLARGPARSAGREQTLPGPREARSWLLLAADPASLQTNALRLQEEVVRALRQAGQQVVLVTPGKEFTRRGEERYQVNPARADDFLQLLQALDEDGVTFSEVLALWSLALGGETESDWPATAVDTSCLGVAWLVQALDRIKRRPPPRLRLVTVGSQLLPGQSGPVSGLVQQAGVRGGADGGGVCDLHSNLHRNGFTHVPKPELCPVSPVQALLWGLGRVLANEHPDLRCQRLDVHPDAAEPAAAALACQLLEVLFAEDGEDEVVILPEATFVNRLLPAILEPAAVPLSDRLAREGELRGYRLETAVSGSADQLRVVEMERRAPAEGEVEIEVHAAGLNFHDVMWALGLLSSEAVENGYCGPTLGIECAGKVVRVGPGVSHLQVGDRVVSFGGNSFASHVTTSALITVPLPARATFEEGATIPAAFFTAHYALEHLAHLEPGERVLIHGAAGGVGLAAIQLAQRRGAEIFATAGSEEKRDLLRWLGVPHVLNSRSLDFGEEVRQLTRGQGVDVVLNSLAGPALRLSLDLLRPFGRLLELGKRDLYADNKIGLRPFRNNVSYCGVDVDQLLLHKPALAGRIMREIVELFHQGQITALPYRVYPLGRAREAFRQMQQSRHVGKILLSPREESLHVTPRRRTAWSCRADGTYLITGGLGGLGLATARWLVQRGARFLVLAGRSGATTPEARSAVAELETAGAVVRVEAVDVSDEAQVRDLLARLRRDLPPLRGVLHAAMVLDDRTVLRLDGDSWRRVLAPKVLGAWHLHRLTRQDPLELFVLFSSVAALVGNAGQGSYAAANLYLEALAQARQQAGLPATAVGWGAISDAGYLSRNRQMQDSLAERGLKPLPVEQALDTLEQLILANRPVTAVADVEWRRWSVSSAAAPRFGKVRDSKDEKEKPTSSWDDLRKRLLESPTDQRRALVLGRLTEVVGKVLGQAARKIDPGRSLSDLGLDSLMGVELRGLLEKEVGLDLPVLELMQGISVENLAVRALTQLGGAATEVPPPPDQRPSEVGRRPVLESVDAAQLSDDEMDSLLIQLLSEETGLPTPVTSV